MSVSLCFFIHFHMIIDLTLSTKRGQPYGFVLLKVMSMGKFNTISLDPGALYPICDNPDSIPY